MQSLFRTGVVLRYDRCMMDAPPLPLRSGRAHEATGPSAVVFAAVAAAMAQGEVLWLRPAHEPHAIMPQALAGFVPPGRVLYASGRNETDLLWMAEEALRSGAVRLVVAELSKPLELTPGRRLQLAAQGGRATGLFLVREGAGSNAAETRWHCAPVWDARDSTLQRWSLIKNKTGTMGSWTLRWDAKTHRISVAAATGERAGAAEAAADGFGRGHGALRGDRAGRRVGPDRLPE